MTNIEQQAREASDAAILHAVNLSARFRERAGQVATAATLRELARRYEELRHRMDQLEK